MRRIFRFVVWTAIIAGLTVGVARAFLLRWWRVPEDDPWLAASLAPTVVAGDLILLWRFTNPAYGDLVLCPEPDAPDRVVVGRLAAEEDDKIRIDAEGVWVNGKKTQNERNCGSFEVKDPRSGVPVTQHCEVEDMAGVAHPTGSASGHALRPVPLEQEVPAGKVFLLSDNRLYPYDSRDYGAVERATCRESVVFRVLSKKGYSDVERRFTFIR
jgi:signal peptidase I